MLRISSPALRLARIASDALNGVFARPGGHDWDLVAADLLVHEAGSMLTTLTGNCFDLQSAETGAWRAGGGGPRPSRALFGPICDRMAEFV